MAGELDSRAHECIAGLRHSQLGLEFAAAMMHRRQKLNVRPAQSGQLLRILIDNELYARGFELLERVVAMLIDF